jgi:type IV pilus assembly protein PilY1
VLIGGLGKGGRGYYAIDVTNPASWTSESAVAGKVLWEFTDSRMGYSFGVPHVVKTAKYGWVVLLSSGYNNSDGVGYLFLVNPRTGALLEAIATTEGSTGSPVNMASLRAFIPEAGDYTADAVYAGDLRGNVWRFDLTGTSGSYPSPLLLARLTDANGDALPITAMPLVAGDPSTRKRYVMLGTGQLLSAQDVRKAKEGTHSFFALVDGTDASGGFYTASTLPSGYTYPLTRSQLTEVSSLQSGLDTTNPVSAMGWYYNVTGVTDVDGDVYNGIVAFATNTPLGDVCSLSGTSRSYAAAFATGKSVLLDPASSSGGTLEYKEDTAGLATDITMIKVDGQVQLNYGDSAGNVLTLGLGTGATSLHRLDWREISTVR